MTKVSYEWIVETLDEHGDIEDVCQWDNFAEALKAQKGTGGRSDLVLVRDVWQDDGNLVCREWAYIKDGKLPEHFGVGQSGTPVPKRFHREVEE